MLCRPWRVVNFADFGSSSFDRVALVKLILFLSSLLHRRVRSLLLPSCSVWDCFNTAQFSKLLEAIGAE
jgi:hypothetical protein